MNFTEVSLTVLYLLQEAKTPLNIEQISNALHTNYTYIEISIALTNLLEKNLVLKNKTPISEEYTITVDGRISLAHLKNDIRGSVRNSIVKYVDENLKQLCLESKVASHISVLDDGNYLLQLRAIDNDLKMNDIMLVVSDEHEAKLIASNWENRADEAIASLYNILISDK
ncbi:MAG: DUF4364 family protein [Clostridiales bacterium]|nr:DUF4364 family protein [Clostridiales bacterium]